MEHEGILRSWTINNKQSYDTYEQAYFSLEKHFATMRVEKGVYNIYIAPCFEFTV